MWLPKIYKIIEMLATVAHASTSRHARNNKKASNNGDTRNIEDAKSKEGMHASNSRDISCRLEKGRSDSNSNPLTQQGHLQSREANSNRDKH